MERLVLYKQVFNNKMEYILHLHYDSEIGMEIVFSEIIQLLYKYHYIIAQLLAKVFIVLKTVMGQQTIILMPFQF